MEILNYNSSSTRSKLGEKRIDTSLAIALVLLMSLVPIVPLTIKVTIGITMVVITVLSWRRSAFYLGLFGSICLAIMITRIPYSQLLFALAIGIYLFIISLVPSLKSGLAWFRWGMFGWDVKLLCFGAATISGLALVGWFFWVRPDINDIIQQFVPNYPLWVLIFGGILFAMVNAAVEEVAYRGIVLSALIESHVPSSLALLLQAIAFGTIHINGFPRGWIGVGLATIYGFVMGVIRLRSGGLFAPWAGHVLADLVIVAIVFAAARLL